MASTNTTSTNTTSTNTASPATLNNLLQQMNDNQEVLQGWDVVMNLLESSVNTFFEKQWSTHTQGSGSLTVSAVWCEGVQPFQNIFFTNVHELKVVLGAPLFQFENGEATITVTQQIESGTLRSGTKKVPQNFNPSTCNCTWDDPSVTWTAPVTLDTGQHPSLSGTVSVEQVEGLVAPGTQSLVLDFAKGAFVLNQLTVTGVTANDLVDQIKDFFAGNEIRFELASLDLQNLTGLPSLTPTSFRFNVLTTNSGNTIVQLLITTNGQPPQSSVINVNEPVPTADGLTCSLMINSRILYRDILAGGFRGDGFSLQPFTGGPNGQAYFAAIEPELEFRGSFSFGSCCDRTTVTYDIYLGGTFSGSTQQGIVLNQSESTSGNVHVTITVFASYPVSLSGQGADQQLSITPGTPSVSVTGSVESQIKDTLQSILNTDFRNGMAGISFAPVTLFALKNLLFPDNLMQMTAAGAPGDLLIVGNFTPT